MLIACFSGCFMVSFQSSWLELSLLVLVLLFRGWSILFDPIASDAERITMIALSCLYIRPSLQPMPEKAYSAGFLVLEGPKLVTSLSACELHLVPFFFALSG